MNRIACILPSRGLAFSETIDEVIRELKSVEDDYEWKIYWSHSRSVPDCLNIPTKQALKVKKNTLFWFVDDDMILPKGVLKHLIDQDRHAIVCDYPASLTMGAVLYDPDGRAYFAGNGCLLVKREVLEDLRYPNRYYPIWRSDVNWKIHYKNDHVEFEAGSQNPDRVYGQHDVHFGLRLYGQGRPIYVSEWVCGQRKLDKAGDFTTNKGGHKITKWWKFHRNVLYIINSQEKRDRTDMGSLVLVKMNDGELLYMSKQLGHGLIKEGKAKGIGHAILTNYDVETDQVVKGE